MKVTKLGLNVIILAAVLLGAVCNVQAHDMEPGTFTIVLAEQELEIVMQPYVTVFDFADDDGDKLLNQAELDTHRTRIENDIISHVVIRNGNGVSLVIYCLCREPQV